MSPTQVKKLEEKVNRLEKLLISHIRQEREVDWLDDSKIVKKLDEIVECYRDYGYNPPWWYDPGPPPDGNPPPEVVQWCDEQHPASPAPVPSQ